VYLPDFLSVSSPLPPPGPDEGPVCLTVDAKWFPYILGCLKALTVDGLYSTDADHAIQEAFNLLGVFESALSCPVAPDLAGSEIEDCMGCCIRMRDGVLQVLSCGEWVTVDGWDKTEIAPAQPGATSPQPAIGKCQSFTGTIRPTGAWLLPVPVNSGDVITITNLFGSWSPTAFTDIWLCPDGNAYFAGNCISGTSGTDAGAPMPTAPLNGTIAWDGTNYYDVSAAAQVDNPVSFTILPGIVNKQLLIRCNFHGGIDPAGEVTFGIEICNNNAAATWSKVIDFRLGKCGASQPIGSRPTFGNWLAGTGFTAQDLTNGGCNNRRLEFQMTFASANIDSIDVLYDLTPGPTDCGSAAQFAITLNNDAITVFNDPIASAPSGTGQHILTSTGWTGVTELNLYMGVAETSGTPSGVGIIKSLTITGHGPQPAWVC